MLTMCFGSCTQNFALQTVECAENASQISLDSLSNGCENVKKAAARSWRWLGLHVAHPVNHYVIVPMVDGARKTAEFVAYHWWPTIVLFVLAWAVVVVGIGITGMGTYSFSATTLSLTIGLGCGCGAGVLAGIFTHRFLLHKEPYETDDQSWHSLWGVISEGIWKLDPISVRPLVIAVAVSVILGVALPFPTAVGVVCGLLIGNHLAICIGHWNGKPKPTLDVRPEGRAPAAPSRAMRALDLASPPPRARPARVAPQALQGPQAHLQPDG